ncbi:MAG: DUF1292 domain-containing protein [Butyrivibrio sp.]|nr:DUF1292 domain-containing protein [Butyrivibrio sp.]
MEKILFTLDDGETVTFYPLEQTVIGAKTYILVTDSEDGDGEALILRDDSGSNDTEAVYSIVEDDDELDGVAMIFKKLLDEDGIGLDI